MITNFSLTSQIFALLYHLLNIYYFMVLMRVVLSWFVNSYTLERHSFGYWLCLLTDRFLGFFRRLPFAVLGGVIDISPIFALLSINLLQRFVRGLGATQSASFGVVFVGMLFQLLLGAVSIVKTAVLIVTLILLFRLLHLLFSKRASYNVVLSHIDFYIRKLVQGPLSFLNISSGNFGMQVTALFVIAVLLTFALSLGESALGAFFLRVLANL